MYIHGEFRDKDNNRIEVKILNGDRSEEMVIGENGLFFTDDPVTIEQENDDTFNTIITKSASINLLTNNYIGGELFADNARSVKVVIEKNSTVQFMGYVEPNSFNQPYTSPLDEFTINCVDCLATLSYYNYSYAKLSNYKDKKASASTVTFKQLITDALEPFKELAMLQTVMVNPNIYVMDIKGTTANRKAMLYDDLSVSELNFYGDDFDDIWTYEDVINEVLQYTNMHVIQSNGDFYIFDWDGLKNQITGWFNIEDGSTYRTTSKTINLTSDMHSDSDTNITVSDVYTQVEVKCDLKKQDEIIKSPLDADSLTSYWRSKNIFMTEYISEGEGKTAYNAFKNMVLGQSTDYDKAKKIDWYLQVVDNPSWKIDTFNGSTIQETLPTTCPSGMSWKNQYLVPKYLKNNSLSPCIFRMGSIEQNYGGTKDNSPKSKLDMSNYLYISINGNETDTEANVKPSSSDIQKHSKMLEYVGNQGGGMFSPTDDQTTNYLVFSGKMLLQPIQKETDTFQNCYYNLNTNKNGLLPIYFGKTVPSDNNGDGRYYTRKWYKQYEDGDGDSQYLKNELSLHPWTKDKANHIYKYNYTAAWDGTDKYKKLPILECELIIGNKRLIEKDIDIYGNSTFEWVTIGNEPTVNDEDGQSYKLTTFSLGVDPKIGDYIIGDEFSLQNTVTFKMNIDTEGTAIPIKKDDALSGAVIFRILGPINLTWNDITRRHPSFWRHTKFYSNTKFILSHLENIIIKDFECKIYTDNGGNNQLNADNDLIYLSTENEQFINKKDDIDFKFVTQLSSEECFKKGIKNTVNLNSVINNDTNLPLTTLYNGLTTDSAKAEEHFINSVYKEYSRPKIMMESTLKNDVCNWLYIYNSKVLRKNFYPIKINQNLKDNTATITLREK
nr:MAG TPA: hypothetical protein [Caudoviricetes sp.]